jgi:Protein of unknown function (DUF2764)
MLYYFLGSALPQLQIGTPPELEFHELIDLLKDNLSSEDFEKVNVIRGIYDIENLRSFWKGEPLDKWGALDQNELEEAILTRSDFAKAPYVGEFLDAYEKKEERLRYFPRLVMRYYQEERGRAKGFLASFLSFERDWRLILTAFRAKKLNRNLTQELQWENPDDVIVAQILAQKDAAHYEPPTEYSHLKPLFFTYDKDPMGMYQALCEFRFEKIEELIGDDRFSLDGILAYVAKYIIVDKWFELDKNKGLLELRRIHDR